MKLTAYQKIMRAAKRGTGCRLSIEDCALLSLDHAINEAATNDNAPDVEDDEEAHAMCFQPGKPLNFPWCSGDGWYRCPECRKYRKADHAE